MILGPLCSFLGSKAALMFQTLNLAHPVKDAPARHGEDFCSGVLTVASCVKSNFQLEPGRVGEILGVASGVHVVLHALNVLALLASEEDE